MSYTDSAHAARSARATAAGHTRRAQRAAQDASLFYDRAAGDRRAAAWLTARPRLWMRGYTPAGMEEQARTWSRIADTMLRASFHETEHAAFYRKLGARYASWDKS